MAVSPERIGAAMAGVKPDLFQSTVTIGRLTDIHVGYVGCGFNDRSMEQRYQQNSLTRSLIRAQC